jgi:hypothetical protein
MKSRTDVDGDGFSADDRSEDGFTSYKVVAKNRKEPSTYLTKQKLKELPVEGATRSSPQKFRKGSDTMLTRIGNQKVYSLHFITRMHRYIYKYINP